MVWGAIGLSIGRSELIIMGRDENALRRGYTAASYIQTLEEGILPIYDGSEFQEDNAPIHTANSTQNWHHDHNNNLLGWWPAYSPDLAPITELCKGEESMMQFSHNPPC